MADEIFIMSDSPTYWDNIRKIKETDEVHERVVNPIFQKIIENTQFVKKRQESHADDKTNPHAVAKAQVGLENVDNTSDADKPISTAMQTALNGKADVSHTHASYLTSQDAVALLEDRLTQTVGVKEISFSIPPDGWTQNNSGRYPFTAAVSITEVKETHLPNIYFDEAGREIAYVCGVSQQVQTLDGRLCFSSQLAPTVALNGICQLWTPGAGGGLTALPIATADTVGGIKASDSIVVDADGTARAVAQIEDGAFATDAEVQAALQDVYGN